MSLFSKRRGPSFPALADRRVVALLQSATVDMNYGAVQALHGIYAAAAPAPDLWDWWLDRVEEAARAGDRRVAALAIDFARKANIEPWGSLEPRHYDRMRTIEAL